MIRIVPIVLLALLSSACYSYRPVVADRLDQGTAVRTLFSPPQSVELPDVTARSVVSLEGEVVSLDLDQAVLSAFWVTTSSGSERPGGAVTVQVPRERISEVQVKQFDYLRTGGLVAAGLVVSRVFFDAVFGGGNSGSEGGGGGSQID